MFCPNCGAEMEDGALFCGECGAKMEDQKTATKKTVQKTKTVKKPKKAKAATEGFSPKAKKIITVQIIVLAVLIGAFYYFGSKSGKPDQVVHGFVQKYNDKKWSDIYNLYHLEESTYINKDSFVQTMEQSQTDALSQPVLYSTQGNQYIYRIQKGSSSLFVTVAKSMEKNFFFFDKYEVTNIADSDLITSSVSLPIIPGVTLKVDGIKEERPSDATGSTYQVKMFRGTHKVTFEGADGLFAENQYMFDTSKNDLLSKLQYSDAAKKSAADAVKSYLPAITEARIKGSGNAGLTGYFVSADKANVYGTALCRYTYGTGSETKGLGNINITKCEAVTGNNYKTVAGGIPVLVTGTRDYQYKSWNSYIKQTCQISGIAYMVRNNGKWVIDTVSYYY